MPNTKKKYKTNKTVKACRICLALDRKMYNMKKHNLSAYYEDITGINVTEQKDLPQKLCWECTHRLVSCNGFRNKALRSHSLMTELLQAAEFITYKSITTIDREINSLTTNLTSKVFENDSDIIVQHSTIDIELTRIDIPEIKDETDLKKESEDYSSSDEILSKRIDDLSNGTQNNIDVYSSSEEILSKNVKTVKVDRRRRPAKDVLNQDIFTITDLSYDEQLYEITKRMDSANYKNSEYKCNECYKGFLDAEAFKGHMARHSDRSGSYKCEICKIRFKKQHALRNHTTSHMQKFNCKQCPYVTTRRHAAKLHEEYHNGTSYQCPHCKENFVKISTYMSHIRIKHPSDFVCELCGYSFVSAKGLGLHKKLKHRFEEHTIPKDGPSCDQCAVNFISKEALENHLTLSTKHNDNITNPRKRVHKTHESRKDKLDLDKKKKRGNCSPKGPIPCEQCDQQLPDSLAYYRHFRRSHPDKNRTNYPSMKSKSMCEVCGKMFQSAALLHDHSSTHTDSKQFRCAVCDKQFQRQYRLIAHRRVHLTHRVTHACRLCDKSFTTASNMQRHMFSHTGLKPFKCEMCGKGFKHASEKRVHITYVHLKKPWPKRTRGNKTTDSTEDEPSEGVQPNANCLDLVQPLWPACSDPKIQANIVDDKPIYYKI